MTRCSQKINDLAKSLEEDAKLPSDARIFTCQNPSIIVHPFGIHFDRNDNVTVQREG